MLNSVNTISNTHRVEIGVIAHAGNGLIHLFVQAEKEPSKIIDELKQAASNSGGTFILETAPLEVRKNNDVWTRPQAYSLMQKLKAEIDPNNILNPGKI